MERRKAIAALLTSVLTLGAIITINSVNRGQFPFDIGAFTSYQRTLGVSEGPGVGAPQRGYIDNDNMKFYYSTASALDDTSLVVLSAVDETEPGILLNLTVINGLMKINVTFSGSGTLYAMATKTLFEDYSPEVDNVLTSGEDYYVSGDVGYLLLMADSLTGLSISNLQIWYECQNNVDQYFVFDEEINHFTGARSWGVNRELKNDYVTFTTNPTLYTNNYSSGYMTDPTETHEDFWYRWNGVSLRNHALVEGAKDYTSTPFGEFTSNHFSISTTVFVDPAVFYDEDAWFCVAPWISLASGEHGTLPDIGGYAYMQSYIGSDNIDPVGGIRTEYGGISYRGRFFTNYAWNGEDYSFQDPDATAVLSDPSTTLREAYASVNLPFFNVRFVVTENEYSVFINNYEVYHEDNAFYLAEDYSGQQYCLETMELQAVNYGDGTLADDGKYNTPLSGYFVGYSNPLVVDIVK